MKPTFKEGATTGEVYRPAMLVKTKEEAREYVEGVVDFCQSLDPGVPREHHHKVVLSNIGYWTGYENRETAKRVLDLYETEHPIFGRGEYSPAAILKAGMAGGEFLGEPAKALEVMRRILAEETPGEAEQQAIL